MAGAPQRRSTDHHIHPDYWTEAEQHRFEERVSKEVERVRNEIGGVREEVKSLNTRLTLMLGGLAILAFLLPVAAPFIRGLLGLPITIP